MLPLLLALFACQPSFQFDPRDPSENDTDVAGQTPDEDEAVDVAAALTALTADLWYLSETDSPVTVFSIAEAGTVAPTVETIREVIAPVYVARDDETPLDERLVAEWTLDRFFSRLTDEEDWWEDDQRAEAVVWAEVRALFDAHLDGATVFRLGEWPEGDDVSGAIDVYVLGLTGDGALVGFHVLSVET